MDKTRRGSPHEWQMGKAGKLRESRLYINLVIIGDIHDMKRRKRKKRILLGLEEADLREAKANAKALGLSVNEYIRRRVNGRPLKAVKRKYRDETQQVQQSQDDVGSLQHLSREELAAGDAEFAADAARAEVAIKESGLPVQQWLDSLSGEQAEDVGGLEEHLLWRESWRKQQAADRARFAGNREREAKGVHRIHSEATIPHLRPIATDSEALRVRDWRESQAKADQETQQKIGVIL